jgi:hypothetical protein
MSYVPLFLTNSSRSLARLVLATAAWSISDFTLAFKFS